MPIQNIKPKLAREMANAGTLFVDVREKNETDCSKYDLKNIIYIPLSEFDKKFMAMLPVEKDTKIILACQAGGRSMMAAGFLFKNGYSSLLNLDGGLSGWIADGLPITGDDSKTTDCCSKPGCC